jgi:hypothetical protein
MGDIKRTRGTRLCRAARVAPLGGGAEGASGGSHINRD